MSRNWGHRPSLRYKAPPPTLQVLYANEPVAELRRDNGKFYFQYLEAFHRLNLSPLPGLQERAYSGLPTFFKERLPDCRRPEIRSWLNQNPQIDPSDELQLLGSLGAHSIVDSFVLRVNNAA